MGMLLGWQASLGNETLYRLASNRRPLVRGWPFIELCNCLTGTDGWLRFGKNWGEGLGMRKNTGPSMEKKRCDAGAKPNLEEASQLISALDSPDIAARAMADCCCDGCWEEARATTLPAMHRPTREAWVCGVGMWLPPTTLDEKYLPLSPFLIVARLLASMFCL